MAVLSELNIQNPHLLSGSKGDIKCYRLYMICGTRFRNNDWYMMVLHDEMICDGQWLVTIFIVCIIQRILYHFYQFIGIGDFYPLNTGTVQKAQTETRIKVFGKRWLFSKHKHHNQPNLYSQICATFLC